MIDKKYCLSNTKVIKPQIPIGIIGIGSYLPEKVVTNNDFPNITLSESEKNFIETKSGMSERRCAEGESYTDMAVKAANNALDSSGISPEEIDLVVVTHLTRDISKLCPPNSTDVQTRINAKNATSINIDMGFSGWIYALMTGASFIASDFYKTVLVVSGESVLPHTESDVMRAMLIGDGAGAFILRKTTSESGMLGYHAMSWQYPDFAAGIELKEAKAAPADQHESQKLFFTIAPNSFERDLPFVKNFLPYSVRSLLEDLSIDKQSVDHYIFAQKFDWLNRQWAEIIGVDYSKVRETIAQTASVQTSSIPIITDEFYRQGKIKKGDLVLFADLGANWSVGSMLFRWCI